MNYSRRQLYALGEPLGDAATYKAGGKVVYGSGGGGGGPSQQTITQSNIPDWLRSPVETVLGGAMQEMFRTQPGEGGKIDITGVKPYVPYSANPADYVAGFNPMQQQAMYGAANLQVPGQYADATRMAGISGFGGLGTAGTAQNYAAQQAGAGGDYARMATDPSSMQAYMSPYMQNVVDVQQQAAQRQADITNQAMQAKFAQSGAFGGARQGIQQAQAAADLARQKQGIQATGLQQAFQNAQQAQQFGANLGLQGLSGAQQGLQTALGGYNLLGQQAGMLGNLGTQELAARQGIIGTQAQMGGMEQQQQQNIINQAIQNYAQAQQYPLQTFNAYNALLRGYAMPGQTATTYQAAPSLPSQLAGLGMGAYGVSQLMKKKGGTVKAMAEGGVSEIDDKVRNNPTKYSEDQIKRSAANEVIDPQTAAMALAEIARARKAAAGINMLPSGLPAQGFAPGGIVAFEDGGKVERYQNQGLVAPPATPIGRWWERTASDFAKKQEENRLRDMLRSHYQQVAAPQGLFLPVSDAERAAAKRLMDELPNMSVEQMRRLAQFDPGSDLGMPRLGREGLAEIPRVLNLEPSAAQAEAASPSLTAAPTASTAQLAPRGAQPAPVGTDAYNFDPRVSGGAAPAPAGGVATLPQTVMSPEDILAMATKTGKAAVSQPGMTPQEILAMATNAGKEAVPTGLAGAGLERLTPENLRQLTQASMPQGAAAYQSELTPMQERLAQQTREAAEAGREESKDILARLDKLRSSQEARYTAKAKDLETDRSRAIGIAFLEAAQAMTQPGQSFLQGLTRSAAAGGKRLMEDRERLDAKADKLADALERVDEARLGDRRERNASETQYRNAILGVERELVNNAQTNYNMNRSEARDFVKMIVDQQTQAAGLDIQRRKLELDAMQGAARNALDAVQAGAALRKLEVDAEQGAVRNAIGAVQASAALQQSGKNPQLDIYTVLGKGDPIAGYRFAQDEKFDVRTLFGRYLAQRDELAAKYPMAQLPPALNFLQFKATFEPTTVERVPSGARVFE